MATLVPVLSVGEFLDLLVLGNVAFGELPVLDKISVGEEVR